MTFPTVAVLFTYECLCIYIHVAIHINLWGEHTHMLCVSYQKLLSQASVYQTE